MNVTAQPLISVVIPAYNRTNGITPAIDSVRKQTYENLEIIVVDDGSVDNTYAIATAAAVEEPRLRVLRHHRNAGAQAARNTGIAAALGLWVAFLDSDDVYMPDSLQRRLEAALREGASAAHSECLVLRADGSIESLGTVPMRGDIRRAVLARPGPTFPGMLVMTDRLRAIGPLDESVISFQEWDTAIRLSTVSRFAFVAEPTFTYDQRRQDSISSDRRRSAAGYEQVVRKHVRSILVNGGPRVLSAHLLEAARLHAYAGDRRTAWSRVMVASVLWPFAVRSLRNAVAKLRRRG